MRQRTHAKVDAKTEKDKLDPFRWLEPEWTTYEIIKTIILGILLFPIRSLIIDIFFTIGYITIWPSALFLDWDDLENKPMSRWRELTQRIPRWTVRVQLFAMGYYWIKIKGTPATRDQVKIIVSNHRSWAESYYFFWYHGASIVTKAAIRNWPGVGLGTRLMQNVFVARDDVDSRQKALDTIKKRCQEPGWRQILIYPEGTTTNGTCLITYKQGAFTPGEPVQPIVLRYPWKHFDPSWYPDRGFLPILCRSLVQFVNYLEVEYLPIVYPTEEEKKDPVKYAERVRRITAEALGVEPVDYIDKNRKN